MGPDTAVHSDEEEKQSRGERVPSENSNLPRRNHFRVGRKEVVAVRGSCSPL